MCSFIWKKFGAENNSVHWMCVCCRKFSANDNIWTTWNNFLLVLNRLCGCVYVCKKNTWSIYVPCEELWWNGWKNRLSGRRSYIADVPLREMISCVSYIVVTNRSWWRVKTMHWNAIAMHQSIARIQIVLFSLFRTHFHIQAKCMAYRQLNIAWMLWRK